MPAPSWRRRTYSPNGWRHRRVRRQSAPSGSAESSFSTPPPPTRNKRLRLPVPVPIVVAVVMAPPTMVRTLGVVAVAPASGLGGLHEQAAGHDGCGERAENELHDATSFPLTQCGGNDTHPCTIP